MSESTSNAAHELNCPNCGAPYTLPSGGNQVTCEYCGSRFLIPESVRGKLPNIVPTIDLAMTPTQVDVGKWVKWLVIFIVVVTVVPLVCSLVAAVCGIAIPFLTFFAR